MSKMFQTLKPKTDPLSQSVKTKNDPLSQNSQKITTTKMFGNLQPSKNQPSNNNNNNNINNNNNNNITQKKQTGMLDFFKKAEKISEPELILIMGDVHIPNRIDHIPIEIKNILEKNKSKFSRILCTGNFGNIETYDWFKSLLSPGHEFNCVKNDFQETNLSFPEKLMIKSYKFKIGIINGISNYSLG
jgi:hypothetical protein